MKRVFPPQGSLGDCFVVAGAANHFAEHCDHLYFPILHKANQYEVISYLFKDNPKITVIEYFDPQYKGLNQLIAGEKLNVIPAPKVYSLDINGVTTQPLWDEQNYTLMDLPFSYRYTKFKLPEVGMESLELFNQVVKQPRYILASKKFGTADHQSEIDLINWRVSEKLDPIDQFQVIELNEQLCSNMILYLELIKHAEEIHCVPSSVFCFVDSITNLTNAKLFYHKVRAQTIMRINNTWNSNRWTMINYDIKL